MTLHPDIPAISSGATRPATPVSVVFGDGIGPEIMRASLKVLLAAGASLSVEPVGMGRAVYERGVTSGIMPAAWDSIRRTKVLYKAPITTPQGGGYKSLNVTLRKSLGLFANVRPCVSYDPCVRTLHPGMDVVVIRENEEDLYAGIEHRQTNDVYQCLKLVTRQGCEKIIRYAFDYAVANKRAKVTCFTKDNIMKLTDGLFHKVFDDVGAGYPQLEKEHMIIDIGAARIASRPTDFDVVVTLNLYGDIVSDIAAEAAGSVGLAGSANVGSSGAMFEAIHGSAPQIAGMDIANPSGLLLSGVQMLVHIGQPEVAARIHNAWLSTLEQGIHTADIFDGATSRKKVGTQEFADEVIARLGQTPQTFRPVQYAHPKSVMRDLKTTPAIRQRKDLVGVDVFVDWDGASPAEVAKAVAACAPDVFELVMVTNRGVMVWPEGFPETSLSDHWRCRFMAPAGKQVNKAMIAELQARLARAGIDFVKTEHLCSFDGVPGFSLGQGQ